MAMTTTNSFNIPGVGRKSSVFSKKQTNRKTIPKELSEYDVVVNAIIWGTSRKDHIIYREDLKRMKHGAMIIDIACDRCGDVDASVPTTIDNPTYMWMASHTM